MDCTRRMINVLETGMEQCIFISFAKDLLIAISIIEISNPSSDFFIFLRIETDL